MYHCHIRFYFTGQQCRAFEVAKNMSPMEHFSHEFSESNEPSEALAAGADVIFANLHDADAKEMLQILISGKRKEAELIVLEIKTSFRFQKLIFQN